MLLNALYKLHTQVSLRGHELMRFRGGLARFSYYILIVIFHICDHGFRVKLFFIFNGLGETAIRRTRMWVLDRVQTHTGHSIAFNMFLHFVILWPWWPLTFQPQNRITCRITLDHSVYQVGRLWDHAFLSHSCCGQTARHAHIRRWSLYFRECRRRE